MSYWPYLRCKQGALYLLLYNFFIKITPIYIIQYNKKFFRIFRHRKVELRNLNSCRNPGNICLNTQGRHWCFNK